MSSSSRSTVDQKAEQSTSHDNEPVWGQYARRCGNGRGKGNWSGINIAAMILGFVVFWPLGLIVMFWIMAGRNAMELPEAVRRQWMQLRAMWGKQQGSGEDNVVFSEYQQTQYDRIREIKDEIKSRSRRFREFRADAKKRADQEEFNRFMADSPSPIDG